MSRSILIKIIKFYFIALELKLEEAIGSNQRQTSEFERKAKEIMGKLRTLLGYKVSLEEGFIRLFDLKDRNNTLIFKVYISSFNTFILSLIYNCVILG